MGQIISIHSFRGGTGKSNLTANISTAVAAQGKRVGVIDTDIQSPGIHVIFGLDEDDFPYALNDYLWGKCPLEKTACNVTGALKNAQW
jgi:MinD-like ATPase involved in chromosome partitioning or flagellar assembly